MEADLASHLASGASTGVLGRVRRVMTTGAASAEQTVLDEALSRARTNPAALHRVRATLTAGPVAAVAEHQELYDAGLPAGLPGGLAELAVSHRAELIARSKCSSASA